MRRLLTEDRINAALGAAWTGFWFAFGGLLAFGLVAALLLGLADLAGRIGDG